MRLENLPTDFRSLLVSPPSGLKISERMITPIIIIDRDESKKITAKLGGFRIANGNKIISYAPTNSHCWTLDCDTIRPLPNDCARIFEKLTNSLDTSDITYSSALALLNADSPEIYAEAAESFFNTGTSASAIMEEIAVPGLQAALFPYQARGISWMNETISHTGGLILADEMGLGKTIQIISLLLLTPPQNSSPCLVVCPTTLIANWVRELEKFAPSLSVKVHRGQNRAGIYRDLLDSQVLITTYDTMVNDVSILSSIEWSWIIADEAQAIKNPKSNRRKSIVSIPRRRAIPMTGTPVENSLLDLWSIADFAIPGLLGTQSEFEKMHPDSLESGRTVGKLTDPIILQRRVSDVAGDLPDRIDIDVPIELDDQLVDYYIATREQTLQKYPVAGALVATLQLQLVCAHPWLTLKDHEESNLEYANISPVAEINLLTPKILRTLALLEEAFLTNRKVLVFSIFNKIGELLSQGLNKDARRYWNSINGSTPQNERQQIVDEFTQHAGPACLVLNPKAAGAGLNITAATVVIHFTPVWNPATEAQASARAHRRGQDQTVTIYKLFYVDTVEEVMVDRANWKRQLANEAIPMSTRDSTDLTRALQIIPARKQ